MRGAEHLWHMRQMTAIDPKQKSMTDRYQKGVLRRSAEEPVINGLTVAIH